MSFSSEVKAEIAADIPSAKHCRTASAAVLLACVGRFERDADGKYRLFLSQDNREALRKCFTLVCKTSNIRTVVCSPAGTGSREPRGPEICGKMTTAQCRLNCWEEAAAGGIISGTSFCAADLSVTPEKSIIWNGAAARKSRLHS